VHLVNTYGIDNNSCSLLFLLSASIIHIGHSHGIPQSLYTHTLHRCPAPARLLPRPKQQLQLQQQRRRQRQNCVEVLVRKIGGGKERRGLIVPPNSRSSFHSKRSGNRSCLRARITRSRVPLLHHLKQMCKGCTTRPKRSSCWVCLRNMLRKEKGTRVGGLLPQSLQSQ